MLKRHEIVNGKIAQVEDEAAQILVFVSPDENEKAYLVNELKLDEHTLNSVVDPDEPTRLELEPGHAAVVFKRPRNYSSKDQFLFKVDSIGFFLFKDRLIVVISEDVPLFDNRQTPKVASPAGVMLKLIYSSIVHFLHHLKIINMISDELEQKINISMENRYLINLFTLEKSLVYYLNAINSNGVVIERLKNNAAKMNFTQEEMEILDDILIENNQCYRQAEIYSNILASLMDARASIVSNNINVLVKTLNIITIGIMVPTFVVSAFSMNVAIPLQRHTAAFWIIMGLALISVILFLLYWKQKSK